METNKPWFANWFDNDYLAVYEHRDEVEAERFAKTLSIYLRRRAPQSSTFLDIACGAGRHTGAFRQLGWQTTGVDLSSELLVAARLKYPDIDFRQADMRTLPFAPASFDVAASLFTSFGYFSSDLEHEALLREWLRVLSPEGTLVIDYLNAPLVQTNLVPHDSTERYGYTIEQERWVCADRKRIEKRISLTRPDGTSRILLESVALYSPDEIERMLNSAGFRVLECWGDYTGAPYSPTSLRAIVIATPG